MREYFESAATGPGTREEGGVFWLLSSQNNPHLRADSPAKPQELPLCLSWPGSGDLGAVLVLPCAPRWQEGLKAGGRDQSSGPGQGGWVASTGTQHTPFSPPAHRPLSCPVTKSCLHFGFWTSGLTSRAKELCPSLFLCLCVCFSLCAFLPVPLALYPSIPLPHSFPLPLSIPLLFPFSIYLPPPLLSFPPPPPFLPFFLPPLALKFPLSYSFSFSPFSLPPPLSPLPSVRGTPEQPLSAPVRPKPRLQHHQPPTQHIHTGPAWPRTQG